MVNEPARSVGDDDCEHVRGIAVGDDVGGAGRHVEHAEEAFY